MRFGNSARDQSVGAVNAGKTIAMATQSIPLTADSGLRIRLHLKVEQLSQVMAPSGDEGGVLPARTITGTLETVYAAVGLALHNNVALKGFIACRALGSKAHLVPSGGGRRWLASCRLNSGIFRATSQPAPAPSGLARGDTESAPSCLELLAMLFPLRGGASPTPDSHPRRVPPGVTGKGMVKGVAARRL